MSLRPVIEIGVTAVQSDSGVRTSRYYPILFLILLIGMLGRGFHFYCTLGSDDQRWIIAARALTGNETVSIPAHFYPRIVWRCVLALWGLLWGLTLETSAVLMFLLAAISIVLVALIGRVLFSDRASLLAAAFHATYPVNVQFDPTTLPDSLAVPLMLLAVFFFARFLKEQRSGLLAGSTFAAGLLFSVKEYFVLIAVPFGLCLLFGQLGFKEKKRYLTVLVFFFTAGLSVDFLLHTVGSHDPIAHFRPLLTYSARYGVMLSQSQENLSTLHRIYYLVDERFDYLRWVLFDYGVVGGFLMAFGGLFLGFSSRKDQGCLLLFAAVGTFVLFLSAMPASFSPPRFVETQSRYAMIFLPMLAIGAGAACSSAWTNLSDRALRFSSAALLALVCLWNLWVPNSMAERYNRRLEMVGIRNCLEWAAVSGLSQVVLPAGYDQLVPDSYYQTGVKLMFAEAEAESKIESFGNVDRFLSASSLETAFFVPLRKNSISEKLASFQLTPAQVQVAETSLRSWLEKIGIRGKGQLVGWLYTRRPPEAHSMSAPARW